MLFRSFITGMEDGIFPHARSLGDQSELAEERRLAYVGLTRARKRLYVSRAQSRSSWGAPAYNPPSRFLDEIPEELIDWRRQESVSPMVLNASSEQRDIGPTAVQRGQRVVGEGPVIVLHPGDRVTHEKFGLGTVVETAGSGDKADATIDFGSLGTKRLLLRYAPVERL